MSDFNFAQPQPTARAGSAVDVGLRAHMQRVYNRMTIGVAITAVVSYIASNSPTFMALLTNPLIAIALALAPIGIIWFGFRPDRMSSQKLRATFGLLSVLYGLSFAAIFVAYVPADIARAFLITTIMFAGLSIFGYTTKMNLGPVGVFCVMGMFGLIGFSLLYMLGMGFGMVEASPMVSNLLSIATIVIFAGLTAYDTQTTKEMYNPAYGEEGNSRLAWSAALNLYLNFIIIFQSVLQLLSNRE